MEPMDVQVDVVGVPKHAWLIWLVLGLLSVGVGIWLILSPNAAITTLALLLAIALFLNGLSELVSALDRSRPWISYVLGGLFMVAGVVVLLRPDKSLQFLVLVVGLAIITIGVVQLATAIADRQRIRHWVLLALLGAVGIVVGLLAIAWPGITVWVLSLLIGVRLVVFGLLQIAISASLYSVRTPTSSGSMPPGNQGSAVAQSTDGMAIAALVLAIVGLVICGPLLVVGLVLGHASRRRIRSAGGAIGGEGVASAAIVVGWVGVALWVLGILVGLVLVVGSS